MNEDLQQLRDLVNEGAQLPAPSSEYEEYRGRVVEAFPTAVGLLESALRERDALAAAGMTALRGYHMAHFRDMLPANRHAHPVESCDDPTFVRLREALGEGSTR